MRKLALFIVLLPSLLWAEGVQPEVLLSGKQGGEFVSSIRVAVHAPYEAVEEVLHKFYRQYRDNLDGLFDWALKDLNLKGERDDMISVNLKRHMPDDEAGVVQGVMDLYVKILGQDFPDTEFETTIRLETGEAQSVIRYEMLRCDRVIDHVTASLSAEKTEDGQALLTFDTAFRARNPYNLMSKKQYRENIGWRFVKFLSNLRDEAEAL